MIPLSTLGTTLVLGGLAMAAAGSVMGFVAGIRRSVAGLRWARGLGVGFGVCLLVANLVMVAALIQHDFSISYVAEVGTITTPLHITIVSLWASLTGSILLWAGVLGVYVIGLVVGLGERHRQYQAWTLGVLLAISVMFTLLVSGVANPFAPTPADELARMVSIYGAGPDGLPLDGPGPNPLLQNHPLMIIHPPTLYLGYVGMSLPFAMSAAALFAGRLDAGWMAPLRRAFLVPWLFLTVGIILGGWWSYEVLGWGGYWAWDPVENASFLPWLLGTAFLHSSMMMQRRTSLKTWTLILGMMTFVATLFGTFLTRSGVFNSVHAFGSGTVGPVLLSFVAFWFLFSVVLLALREHTLHTGVEDLPRARERLPRADRALPPLGRKVLGVGLWAALVAPPAVAITWALWRALPLSLGGVTIPEWAAFAWLPLLGLLLFRNALSRDFVILAQNATFSVFTLVVFLGTTYPILVDALRDKRISVGEPFYDAFAFPLGVIIVWLMGLGPMLPWGRQSIVGGWIRFLAPLSVASLATLGFAAAGITKPYTLIAVFVCFGALAANLGELLWPAIQRFRRGKGLSGLGDLLAKGRRRWGGHIAHYGIILLVLSVAISRGYAVEKDLILEQGVPTAFAGYDLRFVEAERIDQPHRIRQVARVEVLDGDRVIGTYDPALHMYRTRREGLPSPAVLSTPTHDLYLSLMSVQGGGSAASLHLKYMPGVVWIWVAAGIIALGTLIALWPPARRRREAVQASEPPHEAAA
jgi:cytochrome c biogenesis factor